MATRRFTEFIVEGKTYYGQLGEKSLALKHAQDSANSSGKEVRVKVLKGWIQEDPSGFMYASEVTSESTKVVRPKHTNPKRLIPLKGISVKGRTVTFVGNPGVLKRYKKKLVGLAKRLVGNPYSGVTPNKVTISKGSRGTMYEGNWVIKQNGVIVAVADSKAQARRIMHRYK